MQPPPRKVSLAWEWGLLVGWGEWWGLRGVPDPQGGTSSCKGSGPNPEVTQETPQSLPGPAPSPLPARSVFQVPAPGVFNLFLPYR